MLGFIPGDKEDGGTTDKNKGAGLWSDGEEADFRHTEVTVWVGIFMWTCVTESAKWHVGT